jgi:hypothetical protein
MSTNSSIAVSYPDGTIKQVYCHWDGYYGYVGKILLNNYSTMELVDELIKMGNISQLNESIEDSVFYHRDRGETDDSPNEFSDEKDFKANGDWQQFNYWFKDGQWKTSTGARWSALNKKVK